MPRLVLISDVHGRHDFKIPEGDILVCAGDITMSGSLEQVAKEAKWMGSIKKGHGFQSVVSICGNHDWLYEKDPVTARLLMEDNGITYLECQAAEVMGLKFYGVPHQPEFFNWAFNVPRGPELAKIWAGIPEDTEVLVTHGPPMGRLDTVRRSDTGGWGDTYGPGFRWITEHVGCADLRDRISQLKRLRLHAFGHIHKGYGLEKGADGIIYANASIVNESYDAVHKPHVVDLEPLPKETV
jgi:Icc-related predicted phosphoesterase